MNILLRGINGRGIFSVGLGILILGGQCLDSAKLVEASSTQIKEVNIVFIHGMDGSSAATQLLADTMKEDSPTFISAYEQGNPGTTAHINILQRSYPSDVDIDVWAKNIADAVAKHFAGKKDLILIGHSIGGKVALFAVAQNIENLGDIVNTVVTINSPIKDLNSFYGVGGGSITDYIKARYFTSNLSLADRLGTYDSSDDGLKVSKDKHWLAFISAESAPQSPQFDFPGVDPYPNDMDDGFVPISAQYSAGADVVFYGEHEHGTFDKDPEVASNIADNILRYIFGPTLEVSVPAYNQTFEHHANWFPFTNYWADIFGESTGGNGTISHTNKSFFRWLEWEDVVDGFPSGNPRSTYDVSRDSLPVFSSISEVRWVNPADPTDWRLYVKTRAAPRSHVQVRWNILQYQILPPALKRDHYEVKMIEGTSLAKISQASWLSDDATDARFQISSQAEGPFRWFRAKVWVYYKQIIKRNLIDEISPQVSVGNGP